MKCPLSIILYLSENRFAKEDTNQNEMLSFDEYAKDDLDKVKENFKNMDTNGALTDIFKNLLLYRLVFCDKLRVRESSIKFRILTWSSVF